jgi:hypothetical protein
MSSAEAIGWYLLGYLLGVVLFLMWRGRDSRS